MENQTDIRLRKAGIGTILALRYFFGFFFLYGAYHKTTRKWLTSAVMRDHFRQRLAEIDPDSFSAAYLRLFAIPWYRPVAWVLTLGQMSVALSMLLGVAVRPNAALALFLLLNISAGAFYNLTMPPFIVTAILLILTPSGQWLGLDRKLHERFPEIALFV